MNVGVTFQRACRPVVNHHNVSAPLEHTVGCTMPNEGVYIYRRSWVREAVRATFLPEVTVITDCIDMRKDRVPCKRHHDWVLLGHKPCELTYLL